MADIPYMTPTERKHFYHSEATTLLGELHLPLKQIIHPESSAKLHEKGGYLSQRAKEFRLEGVISYESAYTQVAGNRDHKPGHGWSTLTTSVVERLNVLDVLTADRVVSQIATEHPLEGYVPHISLLGTRFENLRIAGHPVEVDLDMHFFGDKPADDAPYTRSMPFVDRVTRQHDRLREQHSRFRNPIAGLLERYNRTPESFANNGGDEETVECSLVNQVKGNYPGDSCGHVIHVPFFGTIYLAVLKLEHSHPLPRHEHPQRTYVSLTMIRLELGCPISGTGDVASTRLNGHTKP